MARALEAILRELDSVYNPQRDVYNQQINALPGQQEGELKGLEAAKTDSFGQIVQGANRRGVAFGGIPLEEQAKYLGSTYLPAVANLKNRFQQQRFNLQDALAQIGISQRKDAYSIYNDEVAREEAARAAAAGSGSGLNFNTNASEPRVLGSQTTLRQRWQEEANKGDWNAQVALNYAGDDGRYDGPVNSQSEFDILRNMGIQGNYYVAIPVRSANPVRLQTSGPPPIQVKYSR